MMGGIRGVMDGMQAEAMRRPGAGEPTPLELASIQSALIVERQQAEGQLLGMIEAMGCVHSCVRACVRACA